MATRHAAATLIAASAAAATLGACGGSSSSEDSAASPSSGAPKTEFVLAKAASATEQAKTAAVKITQRISGSGLPKPVELTATGTTSLSRAQLDLTYDLAPVFALAGQPASSDASARILVDGSRVDVKPPAIKGFTLPGGASWVRVDLRQALTSLGLDPDALAATAQFDPASQLKRLQTLKGITQSGTTTVDGTKVTRYTGTVTARDALSTLPADQRSKIEKAFGKLGGSKALDQKTATEIDVDDEGLVRRQTTSSEIPAQGGASGGGKIDQTIDYSDFGKALDPPTPPASQVFDATKLIKQGLGSAAAGGTGLSAG